jgi:hypothetical protein
MNESKPFIRFLVKSIEDRAASLDRGCKVYKDVDYIEITPPGGNLMVEREVDEEVKQRFGVEYEAWKKGQEMPVDGTPLKLWPPASPAQIETCLRVNVRTVEELARLSETGIQKIGIGGQELRRKAQAWLEAANGTGKLAGELEKLTVIVEQLQKERDELRSLLMQKDPDGGSLVQKLQEELRQLKEAAAKKPRKRGPKKKVEK